MASNMESAARVTSEGYTQILFNTIPGSSRRRLCEEHREHVATSLPKFGYVAGKCAIRPILPRVGTFNFFSTVSHEGHRDSVHPLRGINFLPTRSVGQRLRVIWDVAPQGNRTHEKTLKASIVVRRVRFHSRRKVP